MGAHWPTHTPLCEENLKSHEVERWGTVNWQRVKNLAELNPAEHVK
jgi:hypothetical protein